MPVTHEQFAQMTLEEAVKEAAPAELSAAADARMDAFEPAINAVITRAPEPLRGAPVALADTIMTRGLRSTCGSRMLENFVPPFDAAVVGKLRAAGMDVSAKTNMDEFGIGDDGQTSFFGPTKNPRTPGRVAGGAASGAAAVVAYGGALAALAPDAGGELRRPASFCGLVGIKPTYGRVSRHGVSPVSSSMDQTGVIARNARDAAFLLDAITGRDGRDSTSSPESEKAAPCLSGIEDGIKGLRIGVDRGFVARAGVAPEIAEAFEKGIALAKSAGAEIADAALPLTECLTPAFTTLAACEASANMTRFDGMRYGARVDAGELWELYGKTRGECFGEDVKRWILMGAYALSKANYEAYYLKAAKLRGRFRREMAALFGGVDALLLPVSPDMPGAVGEKLSAADALKRSVFCTPAGLAGLPAAAYPVGLFGGLPAGVQVMGPAYSENILCRIARAAEKSAPENAK